MKQQKYYVKGTVKGTASCEMYEEYMSSRQLAVEFYHEIKELFTKDSRDELAQYISENSPIYGLVTEIWVDVKVIEGDLYSWTEITAERELTETEKQCLLNYLTGQFSDGYGEGLEQIDFATYTETEECEEWDEDEQEYYTEEYQYDVFCYFHLWSARGFKLEFAEESENYADDNYQKPRCKLIGEDGNIFNLMGIASRTLRNAGMKEQAAEMMQRVQSSKSYSEALSIIADYVEVM